LYFLHDLDGFCNGLFRRDCDQTLCTRACDDIFKGFDIQETSFHHPLIMEAATSGKVYNDQWMMERGFLDVKTFKDIIAGRGAKRLITVSPEQTVAEAVRDHAEIQCGEPARTQAGRDDRAHQRGGLFARIMNNGLDIKTRRSEKSWKNPTRSVL